MPVKIVLSQTASVRHIALGDDHIAAGYMANLYIPVIDTNKAAIIKRYEVANQISGLHFKEDNHSVVYAVDDSFGVHLFDIRSDSKRKIRLNPEVENHLVVCSAISNSYVAVASQTFGGGIADVRVSRKKEQHPHVVTLFDIRRLQEPITTYAKKHTSEIVSMEFYKNHQSLIVGDLSGCVRSYNCQKRDEDNALRWTRFLSEPVSSVGLINKRIAYAIGDNQDCSVFVDTNNELEVLFGSARERREEKIKPKKAVRFDPPEMLVSVIKGVNDEIPIVAVWKKQNSDKITLTALDQKGVRTEKIAEYHAHDGIIKCCAADKTRLVTGGEDGNIIIKNVDFKTQGLAYTPETGLYIRKPKKDKKKSKNDKRDASPGESETGESSSKRVRTDELESPESPDPMPEEDAADTEESTSPALATEEVPSSSESAKKGNEEKTSASNEKEKKNSSEKEKKSSNQDKEKKSSNHELEKKSSANDKEKKPSSSDKEKQPFTGEKEKKSSGNDKDKKSSAIEKEKKSSSNDKGKKSSANDKEKSSSGHQKEKAPPEQEKANGHEKEKATVEKQKSYDKDKSSSNNDKDKKSSDKDRKLSDKEKKSSHQEKDRHNEKDKSSKYDRDNKAKADADKKSSSNSDKDKPSSSHYDKYKKHGYESDRKSSSSHDKKPSSSHDKAKDRSDRYDKDRKYSSHDRRDDRDRKDRKDRDDRRDKRYKPY
ncbi:unnamed protein product [Caenorhabditis bovis]|uniref:WD repeat-containing protein 89 n=1 Tax=Caenorhabditis bovis TaxID=2654633 RepID=A0A8S1EHT4_9PELO|nr:unnamed protein product [Caenorhabditis bovis]